MKKALTVVLTVVATVVYLVSLYGVSCGLGYLFAGAVTKISTISD